MQRGGRVRLRFLEVPLLLSCLFLFIVAWEGSFKWRVNSVDDTPRPHWLNLIVNVLTGSQSSGRGRGICWWSSGTSGKRWQQGYRAKGAKGASQRLSIKKKTQSCFSDIPKASFCHMYVLLWFLGLFCVVIAVLPILWSVYYPLWWFYDDFGEIWKILCNIIGTAVKFHWTCVFLVVYVCVCVCVVL